MKKGAILITLFTVFVVIGLTAGDLLWAKTSFLSPTFAKELCKQWNNSSLPGKLGSSGNGWVTTGGKSTQAMIIFARNCSKPKVQMTIKDVDGEAKCTYGGAKKNDADWQFGPTTKQWKSWGNGRWSKFKLPALMATFKGNMAVAKKN
ncbi:MAG TPA: hypothetical protein ENI73_10450, partial [Spirochaetes bacterium]|nr:hypothetical protein [Spirochaetota bacterium]